MTCSACNGTGAVTRSEEYPRNRSTCPICFGYGKSYRTDPEAEEVTFVYEWVLERDGWYLALYTDCASPCLVPDVKFALHFDQRNRAEEWLAHNRRTNKKFARVPHMRPYQIAKFPSVKEQP